MYLSLLTEEQKELFYSYVFDIAMSDENFSIEEQELIDSYAVEMGLPFDQSKVIRDIDEVIKIIDSKCDKREKKIFIFEAIGLAMADMDYDQNERDIINNSLDVFKINREYAKFCEDQISKYLKFQKELNEVVLE